MRAARRPHAQRRRALRAAATIPLLDAEAPYPLSRAGGRRHQQHRAAPRPHLAPGAAASAPSCAPATASSTTPRAWASSSTRAQINGRRLLSYVVPGTDARAPLFPNLLATADPAFSTPPSITVFADDFEIMFAHQASVDGRAPADRPPARWRSATATGATATRPTRATSTSARSPARSPTAGRSSPGRRTVRTRRSAPSTSVESQGRGSYHGLDLTVRQRLDQRRAVERLLQLLEGAEHRRHGGRRADGSDRSRARLGPEPRRPAPHVSAQASFAPEFDARTRCAG